MSTKPNEAFNSEGRTTLKNRPYQIIFRATRYETALISYIKNNQFTNVRILMRTGIINHVHGTEQ